MGDLSNLGFGKSATLLQNLLAVVVPESSSFLPFNLGGGAYGRVKQQPGGREEIDPNQTRLKHLAL